MRPRAEQAEPERFFFGHEKPMPIFIGMTRARKGDAGVFKGRSALRRGGAGRLALDPSTTSLRLFAQDTGARLQAGGPLPLLKIIAILQSIDCTN